MYRKTRGVDDETPMDEIPYVQLTQDNVAISAEDRSQSPYNDKYKSDFFDYNFSASNIPEFSAFKIKIVMKGSNPAYPPRLTDMRAIALAT